MARMQSRTVPTSPNVTASLRTLRRRRRRLLGISACAVTVVVLYLARSAVLCAAGQWLNVGETLAEPVDYVFVLGGDASTRPFLAAAIYRAGYTRQILIPRPAV